MYQHKTNITAVFEDEIRRRRGDGRDGGMLLFVSAAGDRCKVINAKSSSNQPTPESRVSQLPSAFLPFTLELSLDAAAEENGVRRRAVDYGKVATT